MTPALIFLKKKKKNSKSRYKYRKKYYKSRRKVEVKKKKEKKFFNKPWMNNLSSALLYRYWLHSSSTLPLRLNIHSVEIIYYKDLFGVIATINMPISKKLFEKVLTKQKGRKNG